MSVERLHAIIQAALDAGHWFLQPGGELRVDYQGPRPERWELFRGHLVDASQTRQERTLETWQAMVRFAGEAEEQPLVAVKHDPAEKRVDIVRFVHVLAWTPWTTFESGGQVIETREVEKWNRELVGGIDLSRHGEAESLKEQLERYLTLAVVGTSRLPITSLESPLPAFSLGRLGYLPLRPSADGPATQLLRRSLEADMPLSDKACALELALRALPSLDVAQLAQCFSQVQSDDVDCQGLLRRLFNQLALSPYTGFVDNLTAFILALKRPPLAADTLSYYLRHLARHLTAFDLVTFHSFGANYPDALALDAFLQAYVSLIEVQASLFLGEDRAGRRRRRALRQALLVRKRYEGLAVPDQPTSPGENRRVLPEGFTRVPEEQIVQPHRRRRLLFAGAPSEGLLRGAIAEAFKHSLADLENDDELGELGMAVFLDRPLGVFKQAGEVDRTAFFSYEAYSRQRAESRLADLKRLGFGVAAERGAERLKNLKVRGVPATDYQLPPRPGVVALEDAGRAAADFLFLRSTRRSLLEFLSNFDYTELRERLPRAFDWLHSGESLLLIRHPHAGPGRAGRAGGQPLLRVLDEELTTRVELGLAGDDDGPVEYVESLGVEYLKRGLKVSKADGDDLIPPVWLPPRLP